MNIFDNAYCDRCGKKLDKEPAFYNINGFYCREHWEKHIKWLNLKELWLFKIKSFLGLT